ncbi:FecR family protein [Paradesertivirga mongoliensis]|uniref:FecR family protein n=1 Tax=Paradesertivirga mongoliensis TaxID=2100740 RepID=A0ABW4ZKH1_9SPHI|nr:FecR domain-containing protein [Pedobacter mongoliensis]
MTEEKYWNLMSRYLSNDLSIEETDELLAWLGDDPARADLLKELQQTWDATKNYPEDFHVDTKAGWQRLKASINVSEKIVELRPRNSMRWLSIAASLILISVAVFFGYKSLNSSQLIEVATLKGQQKEVVLPDGSKVWLNENSLLTFNSDLNEAQSRNVELSGEAFFEVTRNPDVPFIIETAGTLTQVLGTSFNVRQNGEGGTKVSVVTGKVSFKPSQNPGQELILLPGDAGLITREGYAAKSKFENRNFLYWKDRELVFNNSTLSEVLKTLETSYRVRFELKDEELLEHRITTSFKDIPLDQAIQVLEAMLDLHVQKTDSAYVVEKKQ